MKVLKDGGHHLFSPDENVAQLVRDTLTDVRENGMDAVRKISRERDDWDPPSFELTPEQIREAGEHLSTFGGNPISCTAALATINFLEREKIADRVMEREKLLKEQLESIKKKYPLIGDVRGRGLMVGVELVKDKEKTPATDEAKAVRQSCLEKGLLIGVGGIFANVLRIQPPLVITDSQLEEALTIIEKSLGEL